MEARYVIALVGLVFLIATGTRWVRSVPRRIDPATRTWLLIALIFAVVATWLQWHTS